MVAVSWDLSLRSPNMKIFKNEYVIIFFVVPRQRE